MLQISGIGINTYRYPLGLVATGKSGDTAGGQPANPRPPETPEPGTRVFSTRQYPRSKHRTARYSVELEQMLDP